MTDEEYCDALVEAEILVKDESIMPRTEWKYNLPNHPDCLYGCTAVMHDWRVAGACLERIAAYILEMRDPSVLRSPRAIITAFVESRNG